MPSAHVSHPASTHPKSVNRCWTRSPQSHLLVLISHLLQLLSLNKTFKSVSVSCDIQNPVFVKHHLMLSSSFKFSHFIGKKKKTCKWLFGLSISRKVKWIPDRISNSHKVTQLVQSRGEVWSKVIQNQGNVPCPIPYPLTHERATLDDFWSSISYDDAAEFQIKLWGEGRARKPLWIIQTTDLQGGHQNGHGLGCNPWPLILPAHPLSDRPEMCLSEYRARRYHCTLYVGHLTAWLDRGRVVGR